MAKIFLSTGLLMLGALISQVIKGAGLAYVANLFVGKLQLLANLFTDENKDNSGQLKTFAKTQVAQIPTELATGVIEHTAHALTEEEVVELQSVSKRFGELYERAWK